MTIAHTTAAAVLVLGAAGTLAMLGYRAALHRVDLRVVPAHLATRAQWWNDRVTSVLQVSLLLTMAGLIGLLSA